MGRSAPVRSKRNAHGLYRRSLRTQKTSGLLSPRASLLHRYRHPRAAIEGVERVDELLDVPRLDRIAGSGLVAHDRCARESEDGQEERSWESGPARRFRQPGVDVLGDAVEDDTL